MKKSPRQSEDPADRPQPTRMFLVIVFLSLIVIGTYVRVYDTHNGWTKLVDFGETFNADALPRLKRAPHVIVPDGGNDGQFYAQMAIDPSLQDPAFDQALDNPTYRSRRIGLPAFSFCLGGAKPRRVIQAYALSNLIFWFVLMSSLAWLSRPWTNRQILCFAVLLVSFGVVTSIEKSMVDLPATAILFAGIIVGSWGRYAAFAAAILTRETSLVAVAGFVEWRRPFTAVLWKRNLVALALAVLPFGLWMAYIGHRFHGLSGTTGGGNFAFPLVAMAERFCSGIRECVTAGIAGEAREAGPFGWLYLDENVHEVVAVVALFCQAVYLVLRRDFDSALWRTGICYAGLCAILGPGVWGWTAAAARVVLPMTVCFYLLLPKERDRWFWPFFLLGSLSVPYTVHRLWTF